MPRTSPTRTGGPARTVPPHTGPEIHPSAVPVLHEFPAGPPGVLAGLDGSDGSLWALDRAFSEAVAHDLPLYVIAAVDPAPAGYPPGMADLTEGSVDRLLESMGQVALRAVDAV
ncbi:MAG TPA: universal stress protein, partial [Streptosporangiaceae bacterium]|nr:universal stress protein [Streptosporangiaceae bacterium]